MRLGSNWRSEALRAALATRLTPRQLDELWPGDGETRAEIAPDAKRDFALLSDHLLATFPDTLAPIEASNAWAVAGARSASGKPLLANDPHLGFSAPIIWYLVQITAPGLSLTGATAPGVPFVLLGHNDRIAWGFTTAGLDAQDLFVERIDPTNPDRYLTPEGPRPFDMRRETIEVRDDAPVTIEIRATRHGPVVSSLARGAAAAAVPPGHVMALAATALQPRLRTAEAVWRLDHARDRSAFRDAVRRLDAPAQNVAYADTAGHIGLVTTGLVPVRRSGDGRSPAPGWTGTHDWTGFLPFEAMPQVFDPPSRLVANANDRPVPAGYPYFLGADWPATFRAARIARLIAHTARHSLATTAAIQGDTVSDAARAILPLMLVVTPVDPRARQAVALLASWDGTMAANRPEPLIFTAWVDALVRRIASDELGPSFAAWRGLHPAFLRQVLTRDRAWCDDVTTAMVETCPGQIAAALDDALAAIRPRAGEDIASWRWGDQHRAIFRHLPFGYVPVLRRLFDVTAEVGGGAYTIDRADMALAGETPFAAVHGPGLRAIYDLADLARSRFVLATGQSGNPFSRHYADMTAMWRQVGSFQIESDRARLTESARGRLLLVPERSGG